MISKPGLLDLMEGKSKDVRIELVAWYRRAKAADWDRFSAVQDDFPGADLINGMSGETVIA